MSFTRCRTCLMPTTRPDTAFIDGECSACVSHRKRDQVDWSAREAELLRILETMPKNGSGYDCIVPSSGGKDSHWQVLKLIELGAKPLVVTATTCHLTDIGRKNIDNLARHATTIEVTPRRDVRAKLNKIGLDLVGDISWPEHVSIFCTPFRIAADLGIKTIFYGENPQESYGGPIGTDEARVMTRRWITEFGGHLGLRPADVVGMFGITLSDMQDYLMPDEKRLQDVTAFFLGQFYPWDSHRNATVAMEHGMQCMLSYPGDWWEFENNDNAQTGLHDHLMYRKFGYGRLCAQISVDIRNGLISRDEAYAVVKERDGCFPESFMGVWMSEICDRIGVTRGWLMMKPFKSFTDWSLFSGVEDNRPILKEFAHAEAA